MTENNYSELEKELAKLQSELELQDEMTSRFRIQSSALPNYWQKRLNEEQELWKKRLQAREEEKKILEARIKKQDVILDEYRQKLSEMEKSFERELKNWEEKFRLKEADLLLEKNRILWEEKIKDAESETRQLLEKINALNETIAHLKDENIADREKLQAHYQEEKKVLEEKIAGLESIIKKLEAHLAEVKTSSESEAQKLKNELSSRQSEIEALSSARSALEAQKNSLLKEIDALNSRLDEARKNYENTIQEVSRYILKIFEEKENCLERLLEYRSIHGLPPERDEIGLFYGEIKDRISRILESSISQSSESQNSTDQLHQQISIAVMGNSDRIGTIMSGISGVRTVMCKSVKEIPEFTPSVIICDTLKESFKIARKYPFIDVLCYIDTFPSAIRMEKLPQNLKIFSSENPSASVLVIKEAQDSALKSFVRQKNWYSLIPHKKFGYPGLSLVLTGFLVGGIVIGAFLVKGSDRDFGLWFDKVNDTREYTVPYSMPTAVAADGNKYLWSCDWQGGAIYQHALDDTLTLKKIVYFPNQTFSALTYHDSALYSANPWSKKISRHLINESFSVEKEYSTGGIPVSAMTFIKAKVQPPKVSVSTGVAPTPSPASIIYLSDASKPRLIIGYLDDEKNSLVVLNEIPIDFKNQGETISGLWSDGEFLWLCGSVSNYVYKYKITDDGQLSDKPEIYLLPDSYRKNFKVSGFAGKKRKQSSRLPDFWVSSERLGKIIYVPYSKLVNFEIAAK